MLASDEDGGTISALRFSLASEIVELVVLTGDEAFLRTMREAVGGARRLWHVASADKVSDLLVAGEVGIVVLDVGALHETPQTFVFEIKRQFPDLVVVVAGNRDTETSLAREISAGMVYRFIHKPLSPNRARLFVEAAVRRFEEQRQRIAAAPAIPAPAGKLPWVLGGALGALALVGALFFALRGNLNDATLTQLSNERAHATPNSPLLAKAAAALAANRLTQPPGDNALELYLRASAGAPSDTQARAGLAEVRERLLAKAENALLEERLEEAANDIDTARMAGVEAGRISFLTAQLAKAREQLKAAQALARARTESKPLAAPSDAPAETAPGPAPLQDKALPWLNQADARLTEGHLIEPERDNARYYLWEALRSNPSSAAAQNMKGRVALAMLTAARAAMDRRDFARANDLIVAADGIAAPSNIENSQALLAAARKQAQSDAYAQLLKNAGERLQQDRLIEPANDNAKYYLSTLRGLDPANPGLAPLAQELGARLLAKARLALTLEQYDAANSWLDEAQGIGFASAESNSLRHDVEVAGARQKSLADLLPASSLTLLKSSAPVYPNKAQFNRIEGWVEVDFTVAENGQVNALTVHAASPAGVFDDAALKALAQWRYEPVLRDGKPVPVRSRVRIRFNLPQ